MNPSAADSIA